MVRRQGNVSPPPAAPVSFPTAGPPVLQERMSPAGMSGHVSRLVRLGLVRRESDPDDARRHGLHVTEEGSRILRLVKSRRTAWLAARLEALPEGEREAIRRAAGPLSRLLEVEG